MLWLAACRAAGGAPEPERVVVQHILISFAGKLQGKLVTRIQSQARDLAEKVLERARQGEDFDLLVKQYTDDRPPGIYTIVNRGRSPGPGEYGRDQLVPGFGDTSFGLKIGEMGLCSYDGVRSPFGYHVIKRLK